MSIVGESYLDVDFDQVFYITDTGHPRVEQGGPVQPGKRWDGWKVSVRDKLPQQADWIRHGLLFHSTADIISAAKAGKLPEKIMFTVHPQRWSNHPLPWLKELIYQNTKNIVKRVVAQRR